MLDAPRATSWRRSPRRAARRSGGSTYPTAQWPSRQNGTASRSQRRATALPFADGAFDLVLSTETIEHDLDPQAMLAEMRRVCRGHVLVTTPVSQSEDEHAPDYELRSTGHVNDFDQASVRRLFGPDADVRTFRCNATFALLTAVGRTCRPGLETSSTRPTLPSPSVSVAPTAGSYRSATETG